MSLAMKPTTSARPTTPTNASVSSRERSEPQVAQRQRSDERREGEHADQAGLQPLAGEDVVRMREQRVAHLRGERPGEDAPPEAVAEERPLRYSIDDVLPQHEARVAFDRNGDAAGGGDDFRALLEHVGEGEGEHEQQHGERRDPAHRRARERLRPAQRGGERRGREDGSERDPYDTVVGHRAVTISSASSARPAAMSRMPPPKPAGGGAINANMNGATSTTHVDHGPTP